MQPGYIVIKAVPIQPLNKMWQNNFYVFKSYLKNKDAVLKAKITEFVLNIMKKYRNFLKL